MDEIGELGATGAGVLYGVSSDLRSVRLVHGDADHGLIRLMTWERPTGDGLGLAPMRVEGSRWTAILTADVTAIANHAEDAVAAGMPVRYVAPQWERIYDFGRGRPFLDPAVGVREMALVWPLTRQVFYERFNYELPQYGKISPASHFRTSQVTHFGIVYRADGKEALDFYDGTLGLLRVHDDVTHTYEGSRGSRLIFDLNPKESYHVTDFDDPRSSATDLLAARSGRLKVLRFPEASAMPDLRRASRPGSLGMSLYTLRARKLDDYHARVSQSVATCVSPIARNEFGERSFSFVAPDGYFWTMVEE